MRTNQMNIFFLVNTITHLNGTNLRVQVIGPMSSRPSSRLNLLLLISIHTAKVPQHTNKNKSLFQDKDSSVFHRKK